MFLVEPLFTPAPDLSRQGIDYIFTEADRLADIADRPAAAIANDGRTQGSPMPAIGFIYPLDDLFQPLMFKIHINIRWFLPLGADKPFKQQTAADRIDRRDAEYVAYGGVGGGPSPLTHD